MLSIWTLGLTAAGMGNSVQMPHLLLSVYEIPGRRNLLTRVLMDAAVN